MKKFYVIEITDVNGEFENTTTVLGTALPEEIDEKSNDIARTWYDEDGEDDNGTYWFSNGCAVYLDGYHEVSETTFDELKRFLAVLVK